MSSCGVGNWGGPKPGDPDNSVALSVRYVFGGFEISWTYPGINPHAVAHTILYRGTDSSFELAVERAVVSGNTYSDSIDNLGTYYYWIKIVSINGTENALIGPAVGVADTLRAQQIMQEITGRIDSGVLATALRNDIDKITLNYAELQAEIANRQIGETVFADLLNELRTDLDGTIAVIQTEQTTRQSADEALASQITTVAAVSTSNAAAISSEQTARIAADEAIAADVTNLYAENDANNAAISAEATARATADSAIANNVTTLFATTANQAALIASETTARTTADAALATNVSTLFSTTANHASLITAEQTTRANADSAMATNIASLFTASDNNAAAIVTEQNARTSADTALANSITTTQSTLGSQIASVQTNLQTQINTTNGVVTNIGALYTVRVTVNGLVGGFGIYNDGTTIQAGFDVDEFFVGKTLANRVRPFIISGGVVYIDKAMIRAADIGTAQIENLAVVEAKIGTAAITNAKIANLAVDAAKIANLAVTTAKIADLNVSTLKIAGNAVTATAFGVGGFIDFTANYQSSVVCSLAFDIGTDILPGTTVALICNVALVSTGAHGTAQFDLTNQFGNVIYSNQLSLYNDFATTTSFMGFATIVAGMNTFYCTVSHINGGRFSVSNAQMQATSAKR